MLEECRRARESSFAKVAQAYLAEIKPVFAFSFCRTKESRIREVPVSQVRRDTDERHWRQADSSVAGRIKTYGAWAVIHVKDDLSTIFEFAVARGFVELIRSDPQPGWATARTSQRKQGGMMRKQIQRFYQALCGYRGYPETRCAAADCSDRLLSRRSRRCRMGRVRF